MYYVLFDTSVLLFYRCSLRTRLPPTCTSAVEAFGACTGYSSSLILMQSIWVLCFSEYAGKDIGGTGKFRDSHVRVEGPCALDCLDIFYNDFASSESNEIIATATYMKHRAQEQKRAKWLQATLDYDYVEEAPPILFPAGPLERLHTDNYSPTCGELAASPFTAVSSLPMTCVLTYNPFRKLHLLQADTTRLQLHIPFNRSSMKKHVQTSGWTEPDFSRGPSQTARRLKNEVSTEMSHNDSVVMVCDSSPPHKYDIRALLQLSLAHCRHHFLLVLVRVSTLYFEVCCYRSVFNEGLIPQTTPYFLPPKYLRDWLLDASVRGVSVNILTAGVSDLPFMKYAGRHSYGLLLKYGV